MGHQGFQSRYETSKRYQQKQKERGLCPHCSRKPEPGRVNCRYHLEKKKMLKKIKKAILDSLREKAPLSTNQGTFDRTPKRKPTPKQRRHKGWTTPQWVGRGKYSELIDEALEPKIEYDDWNDFRDGMRDTKDRTRFIPRHTTHYGWWNLSEEEIRKRNNKLTKHMLIIKAKREKHGNKKS